MQFLSYKRMQNKRVHTQWHQKVLAYGGEIIKKKHKAARFLFSKI